MDEQSIADKIVAFLRAQAAREGTPLPSMESLINAKPVMSYGELFGRQQPQPPAGINGTMPRNSRPGGMVPPPTFGLVRG